MTITATQTPTAEPASSDYVDLAETFRRNLENAIQARTQAETRKAGLQESQRAARAELANAQARAVAIEQALRAAENAAKIATEESRLESGLYQWDCCFWTDDQFKIVPQRQGPQGDRYVLKRTREFKQRLEMLTTNNLVKQKRGKEIFGSR